MPVLVKIAQFVLSLSLLIIIHEMGHFIFAKVFKCRVEKFYLFFNLGFSLFKTKKGETEYGLGWLPLGGYVKIAGMIDESMDKEQLKQPPQPYEFRSKPAYQRLLIMVGGVLMNFLAALIIYIGVLYAWGEKYLPTENVKYGIEASAVAEEVGFRDGDKILTVNGHEIESFSNIVPEIILEQASSVEVERDGQVVNIPISEEDIAKMMKAKGLIGVRIPFSVTINGFGKKSNAKEAGLKIDDEIVAVNNVECEYYNEFTDILKANTGKTLPFTVKRNGVLETYDVMVNEAGMIGIQFTNEEAMNFDFETKRYSFLASIPAGIQKGWETSVDYLKQFKLIFNRTTKGYEQLGGFITIGNIFPSIWNWAAFWELTAFLSIILGIMNILPIPALDGGHVMFVLYEMISGRKPSEKFLEYAQIVGLSILMLLVVYANANDIIGLFNK